MTGETKEFIDCVNIDEFLAPLNMKPLDCWVLGLMDEERTAPDVAAVSGLL